MLKSTAVSTLEPLQSLHEGPAHFHGERNTHSLVATEERVPPSPTRFTVGKRNYWWHIIYTFGILKNITVIIQADHAEIILLKSNLHKPNNHIHGNTLNPNFYKWLTRKFRYMYKVSLYVYSGVGRYQSQLLRPRVLILPRGLFYYFTIILVVIDRYISIN